jgi:DNA-binding NarL/FixJ family response regulator
MGGRYCSNTAFMHKKKDAAAVALGSKGGKASAKKLTDEQRRDKARKAALAKWSKEERQHAPSRLARLRSRDAKKAGKLTTREHEIAGYAARGRSNTEIAQHFRISVDTVKKHVGHALEKLGVSNRTELAVLLANDRNNVMKPPPRLELMGIFMLEAAKEAYEMAQYLSRRGQPSSEAERNKTNE